MWPKVFKSFFLLMICQLIFYIVDMVSGFETLTLLCFAHMKKPNVFQPQITLKWETLINSQTLNLKEDENMKKLRQIHSMTSKSLALQWSRITARPPHLASFILSVLCTTVDRVFHAISAQGPFSKYSGTFSDTTHFYFSECQNVICIILDFGLSVSELSFKICSAWCFILLKKKHFQHLFDYWTINLMTKQYLTVTSVFTWLWAVIQ